MLKNGEELNEGPHKENVEALELVYVEGISRMKYGEARYLFKAA